MVKVNRIWKDSFCIMTALHTSSGYHQIHLINITNQKRKCLRSGNEEYFGTVLKVIVKVLPTK